MAVEDRFWDKVIIHKNGCWGWSGYHYKSGYGQIEVDYMPGKAHRIAYKLLVGPIERGLHCLHTCDNPECTNPYHLILGTVQDNVQDMVNKNRQARGEKNGRAKIRREQVLAIRSRLRSGMSQRKIANEFGLKQTAVSFINTGKRWAWLREGTN